AWVPRAWRGQRIFLYFGSVNYATQVWINGEPVGSHLGGHLPFAFEVASHLAWDRPNLIAVRVENIQTPTRVPPGGDTRGFFTGYPATHYDYFPYAGIHRQVQLAALPQTYIEDVTVVTTIEGSTGIVNVKARASGSWSGSGKVQLGTDAAAVEAPLDFQQGAAEATLRVPNAIFWSPETPHLYPLHLSIAAQGKPLDSYRLDIGIRTVEVRGQQLLLNGKPIFLKGFGRHEDFAISGRGLNVPVVVRDAELLKWVGANSFRTSHYPYSPECMELADRYGFLVIDEIPAVGMTFSDGEANIQKRLTQCLLDIDDLIARDKNHPSVIAWSVANEPGTGGNMGGRGSKAGAVAAGTAFFKKLLGRAREQDGTRPATFTTVEGGPFEWTALCDIACLNTYFGWYSLGGRLDEAARAFARYIDHAHDVLHKPVVITECGAGTLAGVHDEPPQMWTEEYQVDFIRHYLDVVSKRSFMVGLHVWNFQDLKTPQSIIRAGGMNNKGVFTRDRRPKMAAHFLRSRWNPEAPR
ncbi:MAG: glycoside hydrolase family 2 TIM barrel-domain containing protein, partial [Acidobacteriota bacterium]